MRKPYLAFAALCLFAVPVFAEQVGPVFVRDAIGVKAMAAAPHLADREGLAPLVALASSAQAVPEEIDAIHEWNRLGKTPAKNGFTRSIGEAVRVRVEPAEVMAKSGNAHVTMTERGSIVWSGSVKVAGAYRLRVHLTNVNVPPGTTFWVYGRDGKATAFGTELIDNLGEMYTPSIEGEVAYLEMELPSNSNGASFDVMDVLELVGPAKALDTPSCLIDGTCVSSATLDVINLYRAAVAHLQYVKSGSGFVCSGALINDKDDSGFIPYMLTANHCFSTQASASSLESFFDYKTTSCGGAFPNINSMPKSNGATLLATGAATDFTFVRLNSTPASRVFLGWSTAALANGTVLHRLSHPFPTPTFTVPLPQRYSSTILATSGPQCEARARPNYLYSTLDDGGVYGGSSGSPVILTGGIIVGQLFGSCGPDDPSAGCDASNYTVDGAFSETFPSISSFINQGGTPVGCTPNSTTACMLNNRFRVTIRYRNAFDNNAADSNANVKSVSGFANPAFETAFFYFNSENNIEILIKVLDQGNTNGAGQPTIAVLFGSATPLRVEVTVVDTLKGGTKVYTSNFASMSGATDFTAFVK